LPFFETKPHKKNDKSTKGLSQMQNFRAFETAPFDIQFILRLNPKSVLSTLCDFCGYAQKGIDIVGSVAMQRRNSDSSIQSERIKDPF
jgi:hypothetical protein